MIQTSIINEHWHEEVVRRSHALYPNQGIQPVASLMARTHPHAIDYMEQGPAILCFVTWGAQCRSYADRCLIAQRFGSAVHRGGKLKRLMAEFNAPLPIRKLSGSTVIPSNMSVILAMRKVPTSDLSQAIPDSKSDQLKWVRHMRGWLEMAGRYPYVRNFDEVFTWAAKESSKAIVDGMTTPESAANTIFDFLIRGRARFNPEWSYRGALRAAEEWHRDLAEQRDQETFLKQHGFAMSDQRDYSPLPDEMPVGEYTFTALRSGLDLFIEGKAMRHCVASYVRDVMLGGTRIYSIRRGEDRVATLELRPKGERFIPAQLSGPCNKRPPKAIHGAVAMFLEQCREWRAAA